MANQDSMIAEIRMNKMVNEARFLNLDDGDDDFLLQLADKFDGGADYNFLGILAGCFTDDLDKAKAVADNAWRSFIDGISVETNTVTVYFRSADGGSKEFFTACYEAFAEVIESIKITVDDDDEYAVEEYGEDFEILIPGADETA